MSCKMPLGPMAGATFGHVTIDGGLVTIDVPLKGSTSVPLTQVSQVVMDKPSRWSAQSRKRTITLHGAGGPIAVVEGVGKHAERVYEALTTATSGPA